MKPEELQLVSLGNEFSKLQLVYGDRDYKSALWAWKIDTPDICLVFMNPTSRNISTHKGWNGMRAPWIGTKKVWNMLGDLWLVDIQIVEKIQTMYVDDWTPDFSHKLYEEIRKNGLYLTNYVKATNKRANNVPNLVYQAYSCLFEKEMCMLKAKKIIVFWNQVSSAVAGKSIRVWEWRKKYFLKQFWDYETPVFPVYYPVWQWIRNIHIAKEDIQWIKKLTI